MQCITKAPAELVSPRFLAAEAAASAALAIVQTPAIWSAIHTMALLLETTEEPAMSEGRMNAIADLVAGSMIEQAEMTTAMEALDQLDRNARAWAMQAHPGARPGIAAVPLMGTVS